MFIAGVGTATPANRYSQRDCLEALRKSPQFSKLKSRSQAILEKILAGENGISTRHLALDQLKNVFEIEPDVLMKRFSQNAPMLAAEAAEKALAEANCRATEMDAVLISTCTGYLCPGLTSYVAEKLGLRGNTFALDLVGQGCGAALPNLRAAEAILAGGRAEKILSISVEICSAAFFLDDDPGVLVSACLFGDGAGAAVLTHQPQKNHREVEWKFSGSMLLPEKRDQLRFGHQNGMLRNILSPQVPRIAGVAAEKLFSETIAAAKIPREKVTGWILHTGGRDVILSLREKLKLSEADVRHSAAVLRDFGNVSSPTVFFVLERALRDSVPDGFWWMSAFGAGFSCHGALLEVKSPAENQS